MSDNFCIKSERFQLIIKDIIIIKLTLLCPTVAEQLREVVAHMFLRHLFYSVPILVVVTVGVGWRLLASD